MLKSAHARIPKAPEAHNIKTTSTLATHKRNGKAIPTAAARWN
jgi:hypothetical protein